MKKTLAWALSVAGAMILSGSLAQAKTVVFSNLNPVGSFQHFGGLCIDGPAGACNVKITFYVAQPFIPATSGTLDHFDLALTNYGLPSGDLAVGLAVALVADDAGAPKSNGHAIEEWIVPKITPAYGVAPFKLTKVASKLHPTLSAGTKYWIVVTPTGFDGSHVWLPNTLGKTEGLRSQDGGQNWLAIGTSSAFDVWVQ